MKRVLVICGICLMLACGNDKPAAVSACVDRPTDLSRPPTEGLPCELLPPR